MDVVRGDLGLLGPARDFRKRHLSGDLFLHGQCRLHARRDVADFYPWCGEWQAELKRLLFRCARLRRRHAEQRRHGPE
jgi:hypothetical protein